MNREILTPFLNTPVKITLEGNFWLRGTFINLYNDAALFRTTQKTALISFDRIKEVTPIHGGDYK